MGAARTRRRRDEWVDDAAFDRQCRAALSRLEKEHERDGPIAIERFAKRDPLGFCMAAAVLAAEEE